MLIFSFENFFKRLSIPPASGSKCKEVRSHHSILRTRKKLNGSKNEQFLDLQRDEDTGQTTAPQIRVTGSRLHDWTPPWEPGLGEEDPGSLSV